MKTKTVVNLYLGTVAITFLFGKILPDLMNERSDLTVSIGTGIILTLGLVASLSINRYFKKEKVNEKTS